MSARFIRLTNWIGSTIVVRAGAIAFITPVEKADSSKGSGDSSDPDNPLKATVELKRGGFNVRESVEDILAKMDALEIESR